MSAALIVFFWWCALSVLGRFLCLTFGEYPRTVNYERWHDAINVLLNAAFSVWLGWLLWGTK
jgi:hypothetical protein